MPDAEIQVITGMVGSLDVSARSDTHPQTGGDHAPFWRNGFLGTLLTIVAGYAASLLFPPPPDARIIGLTRRSLPAPVERGEVVEVA